MTPRLILIAAALCTVGPAAPGQSPDGSPLLVEGPLRASFQLRDIANPGKVIPEQPGTVLFLTQDALYARLDNGIGVDVFDAATGKVAFLIAEVTEDGRKKPVMWKHGVGAGGKKAYVGPTLPVRAVDLKPAAPPSRAELNLYLFHALERFQARADDAVASRDKRLAKLYADRAAEVVRLIRDRDLDSQVAAGYAGLAKYLDAQLDRADKQDRLVAEAKAKNAELYSRARASAARAQAEMALGFMEALFSAIPDVTEYQELDGTRVREERYDLDGILSGVGTMMQAQARHAGEMARLTAVKRTLDRDAAETYRRLHDDAETARSDRRKAVRKIGADRFALPTASPLARLPEVQAAAAQAKNPQAVADFLAERVASDRGSVGRDNPFAVVDLCFARATAIPKGDKAVGDKAFALAEQAAAAARLVPPGPAFDFDRVDVLRSAAALACTAATAENDRGAWARAFSPRAAFAVRLLDAAGATDALDVTGEAREQRAVALMLAGRTDDALRQAAAVKTLRGGSRAYQYNLARMYSARPGSDAKDVDAALAALEAAMARGFCTIKETKGADFYDLCVGVGKKRYDELTRLSAAYKYDNGTVTLRNKSKYPLTNVQAHVDVTVVRNGQKKTNRVDLGEPVPALGPDATTQFTVSPGAFPKGATSVLVLKCDQGSLQKVPVGD